MEQWWPVSKTLATRRWVPVVVEWHGAIEACAVHGQQVDIKSHGTAFLHEGINHV